MKLIQYPALLALLASLFIAAGCKTEEHATSAANGAYPLTKCVVTGEDLGDSPYVFQHDGKTVKLCCKDCLAKFNQDPAEYMAKINAAK
jgi:YHS domain-containing protein